MQSQLNFGQMIGNRLVSHMGHFPQFKNQQDAYPVSNQKLENKDERGIKAIDTKYYKQINISSGYCINFS